MRAPITLPAIRSIRNLISRPTLGKIDTGGDATGMAAAGIGTLPVCWSHDASGQLVPTPQAGTRRLSPMIETKKHTLLVVDDEMDVCDSVHDLLRREFNVLKARSAEEGLKLMRDNEVHIIMTDQRMPKVTGVELLKSIRTGHPQAIRMLFTGFADLDAIIAAINTGTYLQVLEKAVATGRSGGRRSRCRRRV